MYHILHVPQANHGQYDLQRPIISDSGIVPGRGKANCCARALLYHVLDKLHREILIARLRQFVDDIPVRVEGPEDVAGPAIA